MSEKTILTVVGLMFALSVMTYFVRTSCPSGSVELMNSKSFICPRPKWAQSIPFCSLTALLMLPGGYLTDLWRGPKITLAVVGLGSGVLTALTGFAATPGLGVLLGLFPLLCWFDAYWGFVRRRITQRSARMNVNWTPARHRAESAGLIVSGAGLGGAISPILFAWMMSRYGWRHAFLLAGIASAGLGVILVRLRA